jgi:flagellar hook-associated protein 1 FlgK
MVEQLAQVEAAFGEPGDTGLNKLMNNYFSAMDAVASNPQSTSARQAFLAAGNALAQGFNQVSADLQAIATQSDLRLDQTATEIDGISRRITALNAEIRNAVEHNHQPNDLLDERDRLMDDLSKLVNITSSENSFGEVTIVAFSGGTAVTLVNPALTLPNPVINRGNIDAAFAAGTLTSGRALADETMFDPVTGVINGGQGFLTRLDNLALELIGDMNAAHGAGFDLNGVAGGALFGGASALSMTFVLTNPNEVAAASTWAAPGEPRNGLNFANLLDGTMLDSPARLANQGPLGGQSWEEYYSSIVGLVGSTAERASRDLQNADVLVEMAQGRRDQVSGVSMDEEMSNMLRFQHAYNASARVMTAMDEALDMIINRMGRVGL